MNDYRRTITLELSRGKSPAELWFYVEWKLGALIAAEMLGPRPETIRAPVPRRVPMPCIHLGAAKPNQASVPCGQRLRDCAIHGECTVTHCPHSTAACCAGCSEYESP